RFGSAACATPVSAVRVPVAELVTSGLPRVSAGVKSVQRIPGTGGRHGHGSAANGASTGADATGAAANDAPNVSSPDSGRAAATLGRLRWSVAAEAMIAAAGLGVAPGVGPTPRPRASLPP